MAGWYHLPTEVQITRTTRLANSLPLCINACKYSFYPRTIVTSHNVPINEDVNVNNFKSITLAAIKSFV